MTARIPVDPGDEPEHGEERLVAAVERLADGGALLLAAREQLDGQDVGVAVDDPSDRDRARIRIGAGTLVWARGTK